MGYLMGDFQVQDLTITKHNKKILLDIKKRLLSHYPFETGGLIDSFKNIHFYESLHNNCHHYYPPPEFYVSLIKNKIVCSFHSHLHILKPSEQDLFFIKNFDIPIIIYSLNYDSFLSVKYNNEDDSLTWIF